MNNLYVARVSTISAESFFILSEFAQWTKDHWYGISDYHITPDQVQILASPRDFRDLASEFVNRQRYHYEMLELLNIQVKPL